MHKVPAGRQPRVTFLYTLHLSLDSEAYFKTTPLPAGRQHRITFFLVLHLTLDV